MAVPHPIRILRKAARVAVEDREKALFLVRRRLWPSLYRTLRLFERDAPGRRLFLDLGSNIGQGIEYFAGLYRPGRFDYLLYEPNPYCAPALAEVAGDLSQQGGSVTCVAKGVWEADATMEMVLPIPEEDPSALGGTLLPEQSGLGLSEGQPRVEIDVVDIGRLLEELYESYDQVVIKMDIEGAELAVLDRIYSVSGCIKGRLIIYVEFHSWYCTNDRRRMIKERERQLVESRPSNITLREWH